MLGQAERAVADVHVDALIPGLGEPLARPIGQLGDSLDRVHLGRELGQHRRLVAGACADVEHALVAAQPQGLADAGDHVRLRDGLATADRQGGVVVGPRTLACLDEQLPRNLLHRAEHTLVNDVAAPQLRVDHHAPGVLVFKRHVQASACMPAARRRSAEARAVPGR